MVTELPYTKADFEAVQDSFIAGVATSTGTTADKVIIYSVTEKTTGRRRVLLATSVDVDFGVQTDSEAAAVALVESGKLSLESLNTALQAEGVEPISKITTEPKVIKVETSAGWILEMTSGLVVAALVLQLSAY